MSFGFLVTFCVRTRSVMVSACLLQLRALLGFRQGWKSSRRAGRWGKNPSGCPAEHLESRALLTSIVVTTSNDVVNGADNLTSLREAIAVANSNADVSTISFGDGSSLPGGTNFSDTSPDTIVLSGTEMQITAALSITGPAANRLTLDANFGSRIFHITAAGTSATISGIRLTNGRAAGGGAIRSQGNLTLESLFITGNESTDGGGGVQSISGSLHLKSTTVSGNMSVFNGGGVESNGTLSVVNSTIASNTSAPDTAGGIYSFGTLTLVNSTVTGNAGDFGSGILASGTVDVVNSIVSGNNDSNPANPELHTSPGTTVSVSSSLIGGDPPAILEGTLNGNIFTPLLTNHGGPVPTVAIRFGGPAYNAGDSTRATVDGVAGSQALAADQRGVGFPRNLFAGVDIGAFESLEFDQPAGTAGNDAFVLIYPASSTTGVVTITRSTNGGAVTSLGQFPANVPITLNGLGGSDSVRIAGSSAHDLFTVRNSGLTINGASLTLSSVESRTLAGADGNDAYRFDADEVLGLFAIHDAAGDADLLDFSLTTSVGLNLNLGRVAVQAVHSTNFSLSLQSSEMIERVTGGNGNDSLTGNALANTLIGGLGNDTVDGGPGGDSLQGGTGDDLYRFSEATAPEADMMTEGASGGVDTVSFAAMTIPVTLTLGSGSVQTVHTHRTLRLNSTLQFENAVGGSSSDRLTGNSVANTLTGNAGNDQLTGAAGDDSLLGGLGDDVYVFGTAAALEADSATEGANGGTDSLSFSALLTNVQLSLGTGAVQAVHLNRTLRLNSTIQFENAFGGSGNDTLSGNTSPNVLVGNSGRDILSGFGSRDILVGGLGLDTLNGGDDEDILIAGRTTNDSSFANLNVIRAEWTTAAPYTTRVSNLRTGIGNPVVSLKTRINVLNDSGDDDSLTGSGGSDWFFRAADDAITDLFAGEAADVL